MIIPKFSRLAVGLRHKFNIGTSVRISNSINGTAFRAGIAPSTTFLSICSRRKTMRAVALSTLTKVPFVDIHRMVCDRTGVHLIDPIVRHGFTVVTGLPRTGYWRRCRFATGVSVGINCRQPRRAWTIIRGNQKTGCERSSPKRPGSQSGWRGLEQHSTSWIARSAMLLPEFTTR